MATLPREPTILTISSFDATLGAGLRECRLDSLSFIDAYGLVGMAIAIRAGLSGDKKVGVTAPARTGMREHLAAMGFDDFLRQYDHPALEAEAETMESSGVVVPLRSAADAGGEQAISQLLWDQLRDHVDPQVLAALGEGVWEIVANALEHSSADALVMAQVYRSSRRGQPPDHDDKVQVVIGDAVRGIRAALASSPHYAPESDLEAIELALEYLVSSVHEDPGRGQGLSTTAPKRFRPCPERLSRSACRCTLAAEMLQATTPQHAGSRQQARELIAGLPRPLTGERLAVDFGPLLVPTPSYCDEIVKLALETGSAERLEVLNASLRARQLIERSAQNRGVTGRLRIAAAVG